MYSFNDTIYFGNIKEIEHSKYHHTIKGCLISTYDNYTWSVEASKDRSHWLFTCLPFCRLIYIFHFFPKFPLFLSVLTIPSPSHFSSFVTWRIYFCLIQHYDDISNLIVTWLKWLSEVRYILIKSWSMPNQNIIVQYIIVHTIYHSWHIMLKFLSSRFAFLWKSCTSYF